MNHQEEVALEGEYDPLAETADARDLAPVRSGEWRLHRAQNEGMEQLHALETHSDDARRQRVEIGFDVRELGHRADDITFRLLASRLARPSPALGTVVRCRPMDAYRAVVDKRDQRAFLPKPLPDESLRRILQAGRMTGSSKNSEPNRLVVVRDRERLRALAGLSRFARWLADAAVVIVIAQTQQHEFDAGRCAQNMMVAAWNDGIGSCPAHLPEADLAKLLGIPGGVLINRVIGFGYVDPGQAAAPPSVARRRLPLDTLVHWEGWSCERSDPSGLGPARREPTIRLK
jgi:nitroreductase